jgi:6-phosphofructokinase 1
LEFINEKILRRSERGTHFSIVAVAEGARRVGGEIVVSRMGDEVYTPRLGGIGVRVADEITRLTKIESRVIVLGHLQRGGTPTAFDRNLATRFGAAAVRLAAAGGFGRMVALQQEKIVDISLEDALAIPKRVDIHGDTIVTARGLGISFGDSPSL